MPNMNDVIKQNPDLVKNMMAAVQNTTRAPGGSAADAPVGGTNGQYEMQGPGVDISSLMGGIMMPPPPPMNTSLGQNTSAGPPPDDEDDDLSDITALVETLSPRLVLVSLDPSLGHGADFDEKRRLKLISNII